jgi:hypothetical protein
MKSIEIGVTCVAQLIAERLARDDTHVSALKKFVETRPHGETKGDPEAHARYTF